MTQFSSRRFVQSALPMFVFIATACGRGPLAASRLDDTQYYNPNGVEVEVDLEGDLALSSADDDLFAAPARLGQFALTYFAKNHRAYLESIVTDPKAPERTEWLLDGVWRQASTVPTQELTRLKHFRIRGLNMVLLRDGRDQAVLGRTLTATVPVEPYHVLEDAGTACADPDEEDHWAPSNTIYWYLWNPHRDGCHAHVEELTATVTKTFTPEPSYPRYDKLLADRRLTIVGLFTALGDYPPLSPSDDGVKSAAKAVKMLKKMGFHEVARAPVGRRFERQVHGITVSYDIYSPADFAGLGDEEHFAIFQRAIAEHEIVFFDGHSLLGRSDFWSKATYPSTYQIIVYGGCLGYQYYVAPIVRNKGGYQNLDLVASVFEVGATALDIGEPMLKDLLASIGSAAPRSWETILSDIRTSVEAAEANEPSYLPDTSFGVSGPSRVVTPPSLRAH